MTWDDVSDTYVLTTGRKIAANTGILGITSLDGCSTVAVFEGADNQLATRGLTYHERREIADYAIKLWEEFARAS